MGGRALLTQVPTIERIPKDKFRTLQLEVTNVLSRNLGLYSGNIRVLPSYNNKESHGDIDFLIKSEGLQSNWREVLQGALASKAVVNNGGITSFEYKNHQVDIQLIQDGNWESSYCFYAYNDTGSLVGTLAKGLGYRYKPSGLYLPVVVNNQVVSEILISTIYSEICDLMGLRYYSWGSFNSLEDIYRFVYTSKFFNKAMFQPRSPNTDPSPNYSNFLTFIANPEISNKYVPVEGEEQPWVAILKARYPKVIQRYQQVIEDARRHEIIKTKFNGNIVNAATGITHKPLGDFMTAFKDSFASLNDFEVFVLSSSPGTIEEKIKKFKDGYETPPQVEIVLEEAIPETFQE